MSTHLAQAYDWLEEALERAPDPAVFHPCEPSASLAFRAAVIKGDISRARSILQTAGGAALDVPRLPDVMQLVVRLGLLPDVLRAGLRAEYLTPAQQELWVGATVIAGRAEDARVLLDAGFAASHDSRQAIRMKSIRSGAWRDVEGRL
jgi:hypothetical protein